MKIGEIKGGEGLYFSVHPFRKIAKAFCLSFVSVVDLCVTGHSFDDDYGAFVVDLLIHFVEHFVIALVRRIVNPLYSDAIKFVDFITIIPAHPCIVCCREIFSLTIFF